jgi:hypothetical protein
LGLCKEGWSASVHTFLKDGRRTAECGLVPAKDAVGVLFTLGLFLVVVGAGLACRCVCDPCLFEYLARMLLGLVRDVRIMKRRLVPAKNAVVVLLVTYVALVRCALRAGDW